MPFTRFFVLLTGASTTRLGSGEAPEEGAPLSAGFTSVVDCPEDLPAAASVAASGAEGAIAGSDSCAEAAEIPITKAHTNTRAQQRANTLELIFPPTRTLLFYWNGGWRRQT
ncbi:MAG: hypothetical protein WC829_10075 [Hyphomicrobium sp.]